MGMQIHFEVADIPDNLGHKIHKHSDEHTDDNGSEYDRWVDCYIVVDPAGRYFSTDSEHKSAWFDCGGWTQEQQRTVAWLVANRIPFNAS